MTLEDPLRSQEKTIPNPPIEEVSTLEEVERYFAFADPVIGVDWGQDGVPEDYTPAYIAAHPELTQIFVARDASGEIIAGAKVKILDDAEKHRLGLDAGKYVDQQGALLEYTGVKEEFRNNRLLVDLTEKRIAWAKEHNATYISSEAEINNPISIYTKIRDGFVLVSVQEPGEGVTHPYFVEVKDLMPGKNALDETSSSVPVPAPEWKEVVVTEGTFDELRSLFSDGWVGVDIKGAHDAPEKLTVPWTLVLEKNN